jgi:NAD(P)-dependent dehydrogenase (short-subunit alcohol dehydrogenase family)
MASEVDYEFSLARKVALVTGGASGIGAAIGDAYAVKGATVGGARPGCGCRAAQSERW